MEVNILASGSGGNVISLRTGEVTILIDVGIPKTKIENRLLAVGIRPDSISAIFITHNHGDHVQGISIANKYKIPVFAGENEWKLIKGVDEELKRSIKSCSPVDIGDYYIESFNTHHDSLEPLGYVVHNNNGHKTSVCLDTGHVDPGMIAIMEYSNTYIIESNHDPKMLEVCKYPPVTKARILSHIGHLSNEQTAEALLKLIQGLGEQIYLTHLSSKNNMPALAEMTVKRALVRKGYKANTHYKIEVV